jgi:hypothetical protein
VVAIAAQHHEHVTLGEPARRAQRGRQPLADVRALDERASMGEVPVQLVEGAEQAVGVGVGVDRQLVEDPDVLERVVEEGLAERMWRGALGRDAADASLEVERARERQLVSRRPRLRPRRQRA